MGLEEDAIFTEKGQKKPEKSTPPETFPKKRGKPKGLRWPQSSKNMGRA